VKPGGCLAGRNEEPDGDDEMTTAYLATEGFERELDDELARAGVAVSLCHGRLRVSESPPIHAAWAANTWWEAERIAVASIGHAAKELRRRQRNWVSYAPEHRGRARLIADKLPHVAARPLELGAEAQPCQSADLRRDTEVHDPGRHPLRVEAYSEDVGWGRQ
jgi:hypothetical protein